MGNNITLQDIDKWVKQAYDTACKHGFHDKEYSDGHWIMLIITEIAEAVEADRKGEIGKEDDSNEIYSQMKDGNMSNSEFITSFVTKIKDTVSDELADVCIRIFDLAGLRKLNMQSFYPCGYSQRLTFTEFAYSLVQTIDNPTRSLSKRLRSVICKVIAYCYYHNIGLKKHIELKMKYNEMRPKLNGKNY